MRLRGRLTVTAFAAAAGALVAVLLVAGPGLRSYALDAARSRLLAEARLMARLVDGPLAAGAPSEDIDSLVDAAASDLGGRVTVIDADGTVIADSEASGARLRALENHATRPEVTAARESGAGTAVRHSASVGRDLLYAAVRIDRGDRVLGYSRIAFSMSYVDDQAAQLDRAVGLGLVVAFAIAGLLTLALVPAILGSLRDIMDAAHRFAGGDFGARSSVRREDEIGELARIVNASADLLQERLVENERERARTHAILSAMEDGVLAVDHRGTVILANDTLRRNLDLRDPLGRHYMEVIRQREVGVVIEDVLRTGERRALEVELLHLGCSYAITGLTFPGPAGSPHGVVLTFTDVTGRRRLEQIRRDFVANASHELRTPLTSIRGFVEALEDGAVDDHETATRFLGKIRVHADRMTSLVSDLLDLSRLESGQTPPVWEPVRPGEVADDVVASFSALAAHARVELRHVDRGAPQVVSDVDRLRRILEVLVDNAIKYTSVRHAEGGDRVDVVTGPGVADGARLEVTDNGPGIDAEHLPRIFERFYRVDKARSRELGGTGLGLSIAKHLAEGMGAAIAVHSELGHGTRFVIDVPAGTGRDAG